MALSLFLLAACSPAFNWREVPNGDLAFIATFPDKPVSVTRELNLDSLTVNLTLQAAQVNGLYFAVGHIPLAGDLQGRSEQLSQMLAQALANNVGQSGATLEDVRWQGITARKFEAEGTLPKGEKALVKAYFFERSGHLIEVVLMGPRSAMDELAVKQWFTGFKLL